MKNAGTVYGIVVLIMLLCFSQSKAVPNRDLPGNSDSIQALAVPAPVPEITGIKSDTKYREKNIVLYGDHITFTVKNLTVLLTKLDSLTDEGIKDSLFPILLYVNGMPANEIRASSINRTDSKISFELHRGSETLKRFRLNIFSAALPVSFSLGIKGYDPISIAPDLGIIKLRFISYASLLTMITMIIIMLFTFRWLVLKTNVIRVTSSNSKYSLGLAQLLFWVVLVAFAFVYIYALTDGIHPITGSVLTLLTISFSTSGSSRVVDKVVDPKRMFESESKGFIEDIISDDISYSVHRVQMVIWTAILGLVFCYEVIIHLAMPQFDTNLLLLMGISSSGYIGLKAVEHTKKDIKKHEALPVGENIDEPIDGSKKE